MSIEADEIAQEIKDTLEKNAGSNSRYAEPVNTGGSDTSNKDLEEDFEEFKNSRSEHTVENNSTSQVNEENKTTESALPASNLNEVEEFKLQIFLGLFFSLIDGIHVFLYKFISKVEFDEEQLTLDELDREGLAVYFKTKRVLEVINKLPPELIGLVHMEYLYYQKFKEIKKAAENNSPKELDEEKKPVIKRAAPKKKKKPIKKAAKKSVKPKKEEGEQG